MVTIDYTLTDNEGTVIDTSKGSDPFSYIQGTGSVIPGLEEALEGKKSGDAFKVTIAPEKAYGDRNDDMVITIPKERFQDADTLQPGMEFQISTHGGTHILRVVKIEGDNVVADGNHPLAGIELTFDVEIRDVREATKDEIESLHEHSCGCGDDACDCDDGCGCSDDDCESGSCSCGH